MTEPTTASPAPAPASGTYPGKGLGIAGLILAIFIPLLGLILSIVARVQSKNAGYKNGPAKAGIIVSIILLVLGIIIAIIVGVTTASLVNDAYAALCEGMEPGVYTLTDGTEITCG